MTIDIRILIIRPTFTNASEGFPVFIPSPQPIHAAPRAVQHVAPERRLTLSSLCRALMALAFWWVVISLCVRLI